MSFRDRFSFEKRHDEAYRIMQKYPERVPIICEKENYIIVGRIFLFFMKHFLVKGGGV